MKLQRCLLISLALGLLSATAQAAESKPGFTRSLFDGKTLAGWQVVGCEAAVEDGAILIKAGNGVLRSDHRYGDFVLELDWKALRTDRWDSGIYFRCEMPKETRPWPEKYQVNLLKDQEGNVQELKATSKGLTRTGEWNHFKLTVKGTTAALEINGKPAWKADGLESPTGYLCLQAEVPGGGQFLFKNIQITELDHKPLFNGKDLSGWQSGDDKSMASWTVADGLLVCTGKPGTWLRAEGVYDDFNLRLEYRLKPGGNSGVYVRVPATGSHRDEGGAGVEIQILDDNSPRYKDLKDYQYSGSVYAIVPASKHVGLPPGQWNQLEIDCRGAHYRVIHNGTVVVDATAEKYPELAKRLLKGAIGLQNHSEEVYFRNLRIGPPQP
jgi:hypothetical protein